MKKLLIILALISFGAAAYNYTCDYDNNGLYFTGKTKVVMGQLVSQYKCAAGHVFWIK